MLSESEPPPFAEWAFWCERVTYRSMAPDEIVDASRCSVPVPGSAVRRIRSEVRALAAGLPPAERHRALSWVEGGGCIGAIASLYRGEPCGFSLSHRGAWIKWTVRPYLVFRIGDRARLPVLNGIH
ncbi:hypothetical protein [Streptomyces sp. NPDC001787]|uniref:hypothetical protein n=1 Tax=Streptomyces sp. NPDC001787 TaxID=3154523 RepID=UPI00332E4E8E